MERLDIISSIQYSPLNKISNYQALPGNKVSVSTSWAKLPMHVSSADLQVVTRDDVAGTIYQTNINARVKDNINVPPPGIFKVELCSGKVLIVGSPDIPAILNKSNPLSVTSITIAYSTYHQPLELI